MHIAQRIAVRFNRHYLPIFRIATIGLCILVSACQKSETENKTIASEKVELIQQDLVTPQQAVQSVKLPLQGQCVQSIKAVFKHR